MSVVLDASAVLALLLGEAGADRVAERRIGAVVSAVNYAEVLSRLVLLSGSMPESKTRADMMEVAVAPYDEAQAALAASLLPRTKRFGLSLADRSCLALGLSRDLPVLTADRAWGSLDCGVRVELIR